MKILYERSFERDIKKIKDKRLRVELREIIKEARDASAPSEIRNLKSLSEKPFYYRIKIHDYRVGVKIKEATITFIRFLHRKDIYRYFP
jgi:mRNA interferase RelE/StbE